MQAKRNPTTEYVTLTEAANLAPGRPSTNCIWRWCRRGVKSRAGDRVRLQHVRIGGMIYTTRNWLHEFGHRLADADARYFDDCDAAANTTGTQRKQSLSQFEQERHKAIDEANRELDAAGI